jgi:hypothetical protein
MDAQTLEITLEELLQLAITKQEAGIKIKDCARTFTPSDLQTIVYVNGRFETFETRLYAMRKKCVWSPLYVYFISDDDGRQSISSVPRNPPS